MRSRASLRWLLILLVSAVAGCGYGDNARYLGGDGGGDNLVDGGSGPDGGPDATAAPERCDNEIDDDHDDATDCDDTDCAAAVHCNPEVACSNRSDDDGDGDADCDDPDCLAAVECTPEMACNDQLDDDGDGLIDCDDPDCDIAVHCMPEGVCGDGTDNDLDGTIDCADTDCLAACLTRCPDNQLALAVPGPGLPLPVGGQAVALDIPVSAIGVVTGAALHLTATHTWDADLDITLRSPAGSTLDVCSDNGGNGDNFTKTYFSDTGAGVIGSNGNNAAPFTGTYRPEQPFSGLVGQPSNGVWRFVITDDTPADSDVGVVQAADLFVCVCAGIDGCEVGLACNDGLENDGDGLIDCADPSCATEIRCIPEPDCDDRVDNDLDTRIDCLDLDCDGVGDCEFGTERTCDDHRDNDDDGDRDCRDDDCVTSAYCTGEDDCDDDVDEDGDDATDCQDPGCDGEGDCEFDTELSCADGVDNDGDGVADCADTDCAAILECVIPVCPAGTSKHVLTPEDLPLSVFDNQTSTSIITVSTRGLVAAVAARIDISHLYDADLDIVLGTPSGPRELSTDNGDGGDNYVNTRFVDTAAAVIGSTGNNAAPFTGAYRPEQPLGVLAGTQLAGDWSLAVGDDATGDTGTVTGFGVLICACEASSGDCEFGAGACRNNLDDDGDQRVDCQEASCAADIHCIPESVCNDHLDSDLDGLIDCADQDCDGVGACTFGTEVACDDTSDNDGDGAVDCADPDCATAQVCLVESDCDNEADEDNDGLIDCADPECAAEAWCIPETSCHDGLDNDDDLLIDCAEHGCNGVDGCTYGRESSCVDGVDNDGDLAIDCADTECASQVVCAINTCPIGSSKHVFVSGDLPRPVPDNGTTTSTITVATAGLVTAAAVRLDINHTYDGDLDLFLEAPGGSRELSTDNGADGDNYVNTRFSDGAAAVIGSTGNNTAPFTGLYRPEQPLAPLLGSSLAGPWRLRATDDAGGDTGTVVGYQLLVCACDAGGGACEFGAMACLNGVDDDNDGLVDCQETDCAGFAQCIPETACSNGIDDDLDGLRDCADPTCSTDPYCGEICDNAGDDDGDSLVDCLDPSCDGVGACEFGAEHICNDGVDNDGNGVMDSAEPACAWLVTVLPTCGPGRLLGYRSPGLPLAISTGAPSELNSNLVIPRGGRVGTVAMRFAATHTYDADLALTLFSPAGTSINVTSGNGGSGDNYVTTVLVDSAGAVIGSTGNNTAPFTGSYRPESPFSALAGQSITGTWRSRLQDTANGDGGSWTETSIGICLAP